MSVSLRRQLACVLVVVACGSAPKKPAVVKHPANQLIGTGANYACGTSIAPSVDAARAELEASYTYWKATYVVSADPPGALRVIRNTNDDDSVSEGIGYGMLISAYHNDQPTFDGLWAFARAHLDSLQLMNWKIDASGATAGQNGATDADEDMGLALIVADRLWGGTYATDAATQLRHILSYEVETQTKTLKPGDFFGGSSLLDPSYLDPGYYKIFGTYAQSAEWPQVADRTYALIDEVNAFNGGTGLMPDWMDSRGQPVSGNNYTYSYDATRVPQRIARDAAWYCDTRALAEVGKLNGFFASVGAPNVVDGYAVIAAPPSKPGGPTSTAHSAAFVGPAAAAAYLSTDATMKAAFWNETVVLREGGYYNDHLRYLSILFATGFMPNPLTIE